MDSSITKEIFQTIIFRPKLSTYIFGSVVEGTTTQEMGSDVDTVYIFNNLLVLTEFSNNTVGEYLLLVQDHTTPSGYCKLQLVKDGTRMTGSDLEKIDPKAFGKYIEFLLTFCADSGNRLVCSLKPSDDVSWWFQERHGPALSIDDCNITKARDVVHAFKCDSWPDCASEWLTRKRRFNWPSRDMIKTCKFFGFIFVPVGHPHSDEQHLQWRISLSHQERFLVTRFNSVQLKCYILLKLIKKEKITPNIGESLSSYHMKTAMFYTIENTPSAFWMPENLLACVITCLRNLLVWVEFGVCPNYFIPAENMFERRVTGDVRENLHQLLQNLLSVECTYLVDLQSGMIGERLQYSFLFESPEYMSEFKRLELENRYYTKVLLLESEVCECFRTWRKCLPEDDSMEIKTWINTLYDTLSELKRTARISQHTEEESQRAISLILPYIEMSFISSVIALEVNQGKPDNEIWRYLTSKKWQELCVNSDSYSCKLKQASLLYSLGYYHTALEVLKPLTTIERFTICPCFEDQPVEPDHESISKASTGLSTITTEYLIHNVVIPCVLIPPVEKDVTPIALCYEMIRTVGTPDEPDIFINDHDMYYGGWAVVDGPFLIYFLMYLNHNKLRMDVEAAADVDRMVMILATMNLCHTEACLNLLGWLYKENGWKGKAMDCFMKSLAQKPVCNAAFWHIIIMAFEEFRKMH